MKTLVLSMISIAATVAAMTACTSEGDPIDETTKDQKVAIELNAGVMEISSKAAVDQGDAFDAQVIASATTGVYTTPLWTGAKAGEISVGTDGKVVFNQIQYYPANGSTIYMKGYSPKATAANGIVNYTIDGTKDIMVTSEINASRTDKTAKKLEFSHLLTQLQIKVIAADEEAAKAWGAITAIEVIDAETSLDLTLANGNLAVATTNPVKKNVPVEYNFATALPLPNKTATVPETAVPAGNVMILPSSTNYKLLIKTENNTAGFTAGTSVDLTEASKAYEITLTFNASKIDVTATAGKWEVVTGGEGTVE